METDTSQSSRSTPFKTRVVIGIGIILLVSVCICTVGVVLILKAAGECETANKEEPDYRVEYEEEQNEYQGENDDEGVEHEYDVADGMLNSSDTSEVVLDTTWQAQHYRNLTQNIREIDMTHKISSILVLFGRKAFPIAENGNAEPIIAATEFEHGRVLVVGRNEFMSAGPAPPSMPKLASNVVRWMTRGRPNPAIASSRGQALAGFPNTTLNVDPDQLSGSDVYFMAPTDDFLEDDVATIVDFVRNGGGLIIAGQLWSRHQQEKQNYAMDIGNSVTREFGILIATYDVQQVSSHTSNMPSLKSSTLIELESSLNENRSASKVALNGMKVLLSDKAYGVRHFQEVIQAFKAYTRNSTFRSASSPDLLNFAINEEPIDMSMFAAAPDVTTFPYSPSSEAPVISRKVLINGNTNAISDKFTYAQPKADIWRSTGLYARPGDVVKIEVPEDLIGEISVQIGCHTDLLWNRMSDVKRSRDITTKFAVKKKIQPAANPWGGLIYITMSEGSSLGRFFITIHNAIKAPYYIHGVTSVSEWNSEVKSSFAPWSELEAEGVILTVPTTSLSTITNVSLLMDVWQNVMVKATAFAGREVFYRKERLVLDIQPMIGWMHSGYPIVANLEAIKEFVDLDEIRKTGSFSAFHEIGHNYQWDDWVPKAAVQSTASIWSLFLFEEIGVEWFADTTLTLSTLKYTHGGGHFPDNWDMWTGLDTYHILAKAFGWQSFTNVFRTYHSDPLHKPDDVQKYNEWVVRFSREVGVELCTYFQWWRWPLTNETGIKCQEWPKWEENPMPEYAAKISSCSKDQMTGLCGFPYIYANSDGSSCCIDRTCVSADWMVKCESPPCQSGPHVSGCEWWSFPRWTKARSP